MRVKCWQALLAGWLPPVCTDGRGSAAPTSQLMMPPFSMMTADSARFWRFLSDRVMGGVSDGNLEFVTDDGPRLPPHDR